MHFLALGPIRRWLKALIVAAVGLATMLMLAKVVMLMLEPVLPASGGPMAVFTLADGTEVGQGQRLWFFLQLWFRGYR